MIGEEGVVHAGRAADLNQFRRIPTIAADDGDGDTHFTGLLGDHADFFIVTRQVDNFRAHAFDLGQDGFEVLVFLQVCFFAGNRAAAFGISFLEELGQAFAIVAGVVDHDNRFFQFQVFQHEVRANRTLERVDETDAEGVGFGFAGLFIHRNFGVGCRCSDERNLAGFVDCRTGDAVGAGGETDYGNHFVLGDDFGHRIGGFGRLAFVVSRHGGDLFAEHAAGRIDFFERQFGSVIGGGAE